MNDEKKMIRFLKRHVLMIDGKQITFRPDDTLGVGERTLGDNEIVIDEVTGRDLIRKGLAIPGLQHGPGIDQRYVD